MQAEMKPSWLRVWDDAVAPLLTRRQLEALEQGLASNDPCLLQGATTVPPPLQYVQDWPVEAACALGYCFWKGFELETVAEVEQAFVALCFEIDQRLGEPAGCRWFLNWFDETPREQLFAEMLPVVRRTLAARQQKEEVSHAS